MIGGLTRALDNLFGRGEAAVTVPPLDGALRPNRAARRGRRRGCRSSASTAWRWSTARCCRVGRRTRVHRARRDGAWSAARSTVRRSPASPPSARMASPSRSATGEIARRGRPRSTAAAIGPARGVNCITAMAAIRHRTSMSRTARRAPPPTGSVTSWSAMPPAASGASISKAGRPASLPIGLAWPAGLVVDAGGTGLLRGLEAPALAGSIRPGRKGRMCCMPTCRPIPAGSRRPRMGTGWRCSRRAASSSSSCCASPPTASA